MELISQHKKEIRNETLRKREMLTPEQVEIKSKAIQESLANMSSYINAKIVLAYIPIRNEVKTDKIISKSVVLPGFDDKKNLVALKYQGNLVVGPYRTKQPPYSEENLTKKFDVAIIPGIAFDEKGNRLGYGKGYYDRLLAGKKATKIGLAFDVQIVDEIPSESHDVKMDFIVTETRVIPC
ncbi:MAG: 5-formyltetrahydrofolate cyclo-ligase [Nanoarchaeota archaeon]